MNKYKEILESAWLSGSFSSIAKDICNKPGDLKEIYELISHTNPKIAWRAAYLFDLAHECDKMLFDKYIPLIIKRLPDTENQSIKRHFTRMLTLYDLSELADGALIDCLIEWIYNESTPIAVKAHCMQLLYNLTLTYPELGQELKIVLEDLLPHGSKGERNRAIKLLNSLKKRGL